MVVGLIAAFACVSASKSIHKQLTHTLIRAPFAFLENTPVVGFSCSPLLPPAYAVRREGNSFTLFVSSHLGGGVRSSRRGGGVSGQSANGGGGQVQSGGGSGPASGRGAVNILRPLAGGMPLAFTQEDFLVLQILFHYIFLNLKSSTNILILPQNI